MHGCLQYYFLYFFMLSNTLEFSKRSRDKGKSLEITPNALRAFRWALELKVTLIFFSSTKDFIVFLILGIGGGGGKH